MPFRRFGDSTAKSSSEGLQFCNVSIIDSFMFGLLNGNGTGAACKPLGSRAGFT